MEMPDSTKKIVENNVESTANAMESPNNKANGDEASVKSISLEMGHKHGKKTKSKKSNEGTPGRQTNETNKISTSKDIFHNMKYSFFKHVGFTGLGIIVFQASLCCWYIYIIFGYTRFQNFGREWIWLFITMGVLFFLAMIYSLVRWKRIAAYYTALETATKQRDEKNLGSAMLLFRATFINGKYYL